MGRLLGVFVVVVAIIVGGGYYSRTQCLNDDGPRMAVEGYLTAMKDERFEDAYPFMTANMTDGLKIDEWAEQQRKVFKIGRVVINKIDVRRKYRELENLFMCEATAQVSNVLHASDLLNNQGSSEFEIYALVMTEDGWKIDSQETLFDEAAIRQWFPEDATPEFKDTFVQPL